MDLDEHMLFDAASPRHSHEQCPVEQNQPSLWARYGEDAGDPHVPTGDNGFADCETGLFGDDPFDVSEDLCTQGFSTPSNVRAACDKEKVISNIESIFESMLDVLLQDGDSLAFLLKSRTLEQPAGVARGRVIRFPGRTAEEAWRFTVLTRVLEIIHEALVTGCVVTKREIYYRHPALFANQTVVDRYVDDIAYTFGVSRPLLHVSAAAKGLVTGDLTVVKADGGSVYRFDNTSGHLIPNVDDGDVMQTNAERVIVVEKEAIFRSIATSRIWESLRHSSIMVTGKGYPDLSTRLFLHKISVALTTIPIFALVDMDPDGLSIMCTYKYGSIALAHEGDSAKVPAMRWLGIKSADIFPATESKSEVGQATNFHQAEGLLSLSYRDRRKASRMLCKQACSETHSSGELVRDLQLMLLLNMKAELEILEFRRGGLGAWLMDQLGIQDKTRLPGDTYTCT